MEWDKQSSNREFGALSNPNKTFCGWFQAAWSFAILVQLAAPEFLSFFVFVFSFRLGSVPICGFWLIICSAASRRPRRYYSSCAAKAIVPDLTACWNSALCSFSNTAARAIIEWAKSPSTKNEMGSAAGASFEPTRNWRGMYSGVLVFSNFTFHLAAGI